MAADRVTLVPGFDVAQFARDSRRPPRAPAQSGTRLRAGFILCRVDGVTTIDDILAGCGLPEITALCVICDLLDAGLIDLGEPRRAQAPPAIDQESTR